MSNPILKIRNLNVEYPLFGGILQREVSCVHAVKNLSIDDLKLPSLKYFIQINPFEPICGFLTHSINSILPKLTYP